jgi:hypothetical protein
MITRAQVLLFLFLAQPSSNVCTPVTRPSISLDFQRQSRRLKINTRQLLLLNVISHHESKIERQSFRKDENTLSEHYELSNYTNDMKNSLRLDLFICFFREEKTQNFHLSPPWTP